MRALLVAMQKQFALKTPADSSHAHQYHSYFWTHVRKSKNEHTIGTCKNKAKNHKDTAECTKNMGGSTHSYQKCR